jgi:hypothetical protein
MKQRMLMGENQVRTERWIYWSQVVRRDPRSLVLSVMSGVTDGFRTRDNWSHNPVLYQLSYGHREASATRYP